MTKSICKYCKKRDHIKSCTADEQEYHHSFNDEPSVVGKNGSKWWHKNGLIHRDNDLPAIIYSDGDKDYYKDGIRHRTNGPAREWPKENVKIWWYKGKKIISVIKLSENTFQYENQVGIIIKNIEDKICLGLLGDQKVMIGLEDG